ncbi:DUF6366 family protein [Peribacillus frigoritolerans]|nr:DUF6366 family protein [Peribacillus frigoritolerans]
MGTLKDGFNGNGNLADLVGSLGWKGTGILIVVFNSWICFFINCFLKRIYLTFFNGCLLHY